MHCDNRPNADYSVKEMQGVVVSSASVNIWASSPAQHSFDLLCLLRGLGDLPASGSFLFHAFDHSHCHRLTHVSHCKPPCDGPKIIFLRFETSKFAHKLQSCCKDINLPRGGYSEKLSTHMGLPGTMSTIAASPDFRVLGLSSSFFPERRSIFSLSSANLHAICAVWQSNTGAYPALI